MAGFMIGFVAAAVIMQFAIKASYQNGVTDGYGFAREPRNPGYRRAGEYLKSSMCYRWPDLRERKYGLVFEEENES